MKYCLCILLIAGIPVLAGTPDYQSPFKINANGTPIELGLGHANPLVTDWNGDGLKDLVVGEGSGLTGFGLVRVYLNSGTPGTPVFTGYFYAQSNGSDMQSPGAG